MAVPDSGRERLKAWWQRIWHALAGIAVFALAGSAGYVVISLHASRMEARERVELIAFGASVRARLERELSGVLFLSSGLTSYLAVRYTDLRGDEVQEILASLYHSARHVRNMGVAVGYRITYIYPIEGNLKVIGLNYTDIPEQWPHVQRAVENAEAVLAGPVDLVQGGRGFIYRVPVYVRSEYWGLLSTVIDVDSLFRSAFGGIGNGNVAFAVRGKDGQGMQGDVFWGDASLFERAGAEVFEFEVPGGRWAIATWRQASHAAHSELSLLGALGALFALFLGWGTQIVLAQRAQLTRMALYDPLTGLPNRHLVEDRIAHAMSSQRRNRLTVSALLFIDLDGFKLVNDRHGHRAGDALLQGVAKNLQGAVRAADTVGRWGGDEFIVLLENVDRRKLPDLVDNLRNAVKIPVEYGAHELAVGASIGTAVIPDHGRTVGDLVRAADARMYDDKQQRRIPAT